ncbi:unnamed protein product [Brugia pahangi]|nr:unnamed protein product [Brugia pahangi]
MNGKQVLELDSDSVASSISQRNTGNIKGADNDFVAWVEKYSDLSSSTNATSNMPVVTLSDDTDSVKKRKAFSFFKRSSRHKEGCSK